MMKIVKKHFDFLTLLSSGSKQQRQGLLSSAAGEQIKALREIFHNLLLGNILISKLLFKKISPYKKTLRSLGSVKSTPSKKELVRGEKIIALTLSVVLPKLKHLLLGVSRKVKK